MMTKDEGSQGALAQRVYRAVLLDPQWTSHTIAQGVGASPAAVDDVLRQLESVGLVAPSPTSESGYAAVDPDAALTRLFAVENRQLTRHQEEVARTRDAIAVIMRDFLDIRAAQRNSVEIEELRTPGQINAFLDDVSSLVKEQEWGMHVGSPPPVEVVDEMLLRDKAVLSAGIAMRALYLHRHAQDPFMAGYLEELAREGVQVRLATHLPFRMLLIDQDLALVPINPADSSQGAFAIRGGELVRSLRAVYEHCWISATPFEAASGRPAQEDAAGQAGAALSPSEVVIVRLLADGAKDDAIARRLGVSTRTLSRMISALLERLGVQTRFQAALEIGRRGWLEGRAQEADTL